MLDASDLLAAFSDAVLRSATASGSKSYFSNWIAHDLQGALGNIDDKTPEGLVKYVGSFSGRLLDFGCGDAPHRALLEKYEWQWTGLDYDGSIDPTALKRSAVLENTVVKYDGVHFPFEDASFDGVWSSQSLEHVHSAEDTFREISRVLKPNGILFGSTSFLEGYHARSTFCYTPYGFKLLANRYGLTLEKIFPYVDGPSLIFRQLFMMLGISEAEYGNWTKMMKGGGVFFELLRQRAASTGDAPNLAEAMAQICGQFFFIARKNPPS